MQTFRLIMFMTLLSLGATGLNARDLKEIVASGYINVGVRLSPVIFSEAADGTRDGLCWKLAVAFAKSLGVEARAVIVTDSKEYWTYAETQGEKNDPVAYSKVDIAADVFSMNAVRAKQVNMVPFLDVSEIFVARKGGEITKPSDLLGKSLVVTENQMSHETARLFVKNNNLPFTETLFEIRADTNGNYFLFFPKPRWQKNKNTVEILVLTGDLHKIRSSALYELLAESKVDSAISNSLTLVTFNHVFSSMRRLFSLGPVANPEISQLYFGVPLSAPDLVESFETYLEKARKDGGFSAVLQDAFGLSLAEYTALINQR